MRLFVWLIFWRDSSVTKCEIHSNSCFYHSALSVFYVVHCTIVFNPLQFHFLGFVSFFLSLHSLVVLLLSLLVSSHSLFFFFVLFLTLINSHLFLFHYSILHICFFFDLISELRGKQLFLFFLLCAFLSFCKAPLSSLVI